MVQTPFALFGPGHIHGRRRRFGFCPLVNTIRLILIIHGRLSLRSVFRSGVFAFAFFWGYIWFCQYMLIWYSNIPEETSWFEHRFHGGWFAINMFSFALNFVIPFVVLLSARVKKDRRMLLRMATIVLVGRVLDLLIITTPSYSVEAAFGLWEVLPPIGAMAMLFLAILQPPRAAVTLAPKLD